MTGQNVLVVVDMQNDFIDGVLGTTEAVNIVPAVRKKIEEAHERGDVVVFTRDTHSDNYLDTQEGKKLPVPHCIWKTRGWQISSKIQVDENNDLFFNKTTFGCIHLSEYLLRHHAHPKQIEIIGLCTDICVISNALLMKTIFPDVPIVVDAACCAGVTPETHKNALNAMRMCHIDVINDE